MVFYAPPSRLLSGIAHIANNYRAVAIFRNTVLADLRAKAERTMLQTFDRIRREPPRLPGDLEAHRLSRDRPLPVAAYHLKQRSTANCGLQGDRCS